MAQNIAGQTNTLSGGDGQTQSDRGKNVYDATAITATDFTPRYVKWVNLTDRVTIEWFEGMGANECLKTAANGTQTYEVTGGNGGITVAQGNFQVLQNATLGAILASKTCYWEAWR